MLLTWKQAKLARKVKIGKINLSNYDTKLKEKEWPIWDQLESNGMIDRLLRSPEALKKANRLMSDVKPTLGNQHKKQQKPSNIK